MNRYASGANIEREIKKKLESDGFSVIRSAGSKGSIDLVAYDNKIIKFIQVKYAPDKKHMKVTKKEYAKLRKLVVPACATKEIWFRIRRVKEYVIFYVQ